MSPAFISVLEVHLHQGQSRSLKEKRKLVQSLKAQLRRRFGASVAEVGGHDTWQSTTLLCALVGDSGLEARTDEIARFVESRCPEGCRFERNLLSLEDVRG